MRNTCAARGQATVREGKERKKGKHLKKVLKGRKKIGVMLGG